MVILTILDGWGHGQDPQKSAISQAQTPVMDQLYKSYPNAELITFGEEVGLPEGQMGNSEVGHLNIGAGRVVYQELARINVALKSGALAQNEVLCAAIDKAKSENRNIHLMGLVSDGGVHSHINHLKGLCDILHKAEVPKTFIHAFLDGRDTDPKSGAAYIEELTQHIKGKNVALSTLVGRFYAMDRDNRWERIKVAYDLLVNGEAETISMDAVDAIRQWYDDGITDEFMKPIAISPTKEEIATIQEGDILICFNFRTDRPREISTVLTQKDMPEYGMAKLSLTYLTMTTYDSSYENVSVMFTKDNLDKTLGEVLADGNKTQLRIAETEKYPHVTFFFSGGREEAFDGEKRILVPSPKVATYDMQPEMSAKEITDKLLAHLQNERPDFVCLNFANTDMVGHTGDFDAAIKAAETVDTCLGTICDTALPMGYNLLVIADHGNSDYMINEDGSPNTAHTLNPVPVILVGEGITKDNCIMRSGKLGDVAPTILGLLDMNVPKEMTGDNLVAKR